MGTCLSINKKSSVGIQPDTSNAGSCTSTVITTHYTTSITTNYSNDNNDNNDSYVSECNDEKS